MSPFADRLHQSLSDPFLIYAIDVYDMWRIISRFYQIMAARGLNMLSTAPLAYGETRDDYANAATALFYEELQQALLPARRIGLELILPDRGINGTLFEAAHGPDRLYKPGEWKTKKIGEVDTIYMHHLSMPFPTASHTPKAVLSMYSGKIHPPLQQQCWTATSSPCLTMTAWGVDLNYKRLNPIQLEAMKAFVDISVEEEATNQYRLFIE
jgi:hypothetical protein